MIILQPHVHNARLVLPMNGTNGSTTFTDTSQSVLTVTPNGNAQISTAQSKFGGSSALLDGTGDWLYTTGAAISPGSNDFSISCYVRAANVTNAGIFQLSDTAGGFKTTARGLVLAFNSGGGGLVWSYASTDAFITQTVSLNTWHLVELIRRAGVIKVMFNGAQVASTNDATNYANNKYLVIGGYYSSSYCLNGYIDEFEITVG